MPGQALMFPQEIEAARFHDTQQGKIVSPTYRLPLSARKYSWYS